MAPKNFMAGRDGTAQKAPSNRISRWLSDSKERRREARDNAARMITNEMARNETLIVDTLMSINFANSRLPQEELSKRTREGQSCCDLEYACRAMVQAMQKDAKVVKVDVRRVDEKLLTLVMMFKQCIEDGDRDAAYMAQRAIVRGIKNVRMRIPSDRPELAKQFVDVNTRYLDEWITTVGMAQVCDRIKENLDAQKAASKVRREKLDGEIEAHRKKLEEDPEYRNAFNSILKHDTPEERTKWTDKQKEVHRLMIEQRYRRRNQEIGEKQVDQLETQYIAKKAEVEMMRDNLAATMIVADPDQMNKFKEAVDRMFEDFARRDAQIDEMLKYADELDGRLAQIDHLPGTIRATEVAAEEAEKTLNELIAAQQKETGEQNDKNVSMADMGLKTKEEIENLRTQREREQIEEVNELEDTESQTLYN